MDGYRLCGSFNWVLDFIAPMGKLGMPNGSALEVGVLSESELSVFTILTLEIVTFP